MKKVTEIPGNIGKAVKLKVAAYCRVSTDSKEQLASLDAQTKHYEEYIKSNPDWQFTEIYYDEGISGTKKENRKDLLRLLSDCENRLIDLIISKSISRLARNTMDCLEIVRMLTDFGIYIFFEKENINTQYTINGRGTNVNHIEQPCRERVYLHLREQHLGHQAQVP